SVPSRSKMRAVTALERSGRRLSSRLLFAGPPQKLDERIPPPPWCEAHQKREVEGDVLEEVVPRGEEESYVEQDGAHEKQRGRSRQEQGQEVEQLEEDRKDREHDGEVVLLRQPDAEGIATPHRIAEGVPLQCVAVHPREPA